MSMSFDSSTYADQDVFEEEIDGMAAAAPAARSMPIAWVAFVAVVALLGLAGGIASPFAGTQPESPFVAPVSP